MSGIQLMFLGQAQGNIATSTFINTYAIGSAVSTYNFTTATIPAGLVAITISAEDPSNTAISSVTIGGVSATRAAEFSQTIAAGTVAAIWYAVIGSSTTSVSVSFGLAQLRCGIGVYTIENYLSATPVYTNAVGGSSITETITTPSINKGSSIIAVRTSGDLYSHTWSGVTENYDNKIAGGLTGQTGASLDTSTTQTHTIQSTVLSSPTQGTTMAVAVWS